MPAARSRRTARYISHLEMHRRCFASTPKHKPHRCSGQSSKVRAILCWRRAFGEQQDILAPSDAPQVLCIDPELMLCGPVRTTSVPSAPLLVQLVTTVDQCVSLTSFLAWVPAGGGRLGVHYETGLRDGKLQVASLLLRRDSKTRSGCLILISTVLSGHVPVGQCLGNDSPMDPSSCNGCRGQGEVP